MMEKTFDSNSKKRVSYILVTKNRAKFLDQALFRYRDFVKPQDELIVVDGASTDETADIVKKYEDIVDIFISEPDKHGGEAANKGFLLARGKYVKQISDDDIFYSDGIDKAVEIMEKNPKIGLLLCGGIKEYNGRKRAVCLPRGINYGKKPEDLFIYKGGDSGVGHLIRRSALAKAGLYGFNSNADKELVLRFMGNGCTVRFARINLYHHFLFDHSVIMKNGTAHKKDTIRLAKKYCSKSFYIKYRINNFFKESKLFRFPYLLYLGFLRRFKPSPKKIECVWDGELS